MERDSFYYERLFEIMFPNLKRFDLKEEIEKIVDLLKKTFIDIEVEYDIRYGSELVFHIERIARYDIDWNISFDLSRYPIKHKDDLKEMIFPKIKYSFLEFWDNKILRSEYERDRI